MIPPIPLDPETVAAIRRIIWFEEAEQAARDPVRLLAYAFRYATHADMKHLRRHFSDDDLRTALTNAPPGIIDGRSWGYWHAILGQYPPPPMPVRQFGVAHFAAPQQSPVDLNAPTS